MLSKKTIENVLEASLTYGGDFAEIFVEDKSNLSLNLIGGDLDRNIAGRDYGVGIRIFDNFNSIYAYTNNSDEDNLIKVAKKASEAIMKKSVQLKMELIDKKLMNNNPIKLIPSDVNIREKIDLMRSGYEAAKTYDDLISQVSVNYMEEDQKVLIANTEGVLVQDRRIRTRYSVTSIASKDGEMQRGYYAPGASMGFEFFDCNDVKEIGKEASRIAKTMIFADHAPAGVMPVIIDNEFGGVLFHEACGHGLEAEFVSKGISSFTGKLGEKIASDVVTAVDDGTLKNGWGTSNVDDEGTETKRNVLIENGVLKSYLVDKLNGKRMGMESTGSSRRQSYKFAPTSRMNNTFIDGGKSSLEDMIANTEKGLYAKKLGGGSVDTATGDFNFAIMEAYIIENGKLKNPVKGATIVGNGSRVLKNIDMVGNNLKLGEGMCGASSGSIPAGVGQPTIRVQDMTVGGREEK